jgi:hypothetical protein
MTTADARDDLLAMIGIEDPAHASESILKRIKSDINLTLQKIWTMASPWWSYGKSGGILRGPLAVSGISTTLGSVVISDPASQIDASMIGQTIRLGDDPFDNEIATFDPITKLGSLMRPYAGITSIDASGYIYTDTIILPDNVMSVIPPVLIYGEHELKPLRSQRDIMSFSESINFNSYSESSVGPSSTVIAENRDIDVPVGFYIENYRRATGKTTLRMRVSPLPDKEYILRYDVRYGAPEIAALDSATDIPIPQNYTHSILLPILRYQFSTWKHVNLGNQGNEYKTHYDEAWQLLSKLKPQPIAVGRVRIVY